MGRPSFIDVAGEKMLKKIMRNSKTPRLLGLAVVVAIAVVIVAVAVMFFALGPAILTMMTFAA